MQNCHMSLKQSDFKGERVIKCKGTRTNNRRDEMRKAGVSTCKWDVNVKGESEWDLIETFQESNGPRDSRHSKCQTEKQ